MLLAGIQFGGFHRSCLFLSLLLLNSCVSYGPRVLVPSITLSPEELSFTTVESTAQESVDFGLQISANESDSLANIEILPGVRVRAVALNSAADSAGIQVGDIILSIDGMETNHPDVIDQLARQTKSAKEFTFTARRNTVVFEAKVTAREVTGITTPRELYRADPIASRAGYQTEILTMANRSNVSAARIVKIFPGSPLGDAGVAIGDVVLAVDGVPVQSAQGLINRLSQDSELGETVVFSVYSGALIKQSPVVLWDPSRRISRISLGPLLQYESSLSPLSSSLSILDFWLFSFYNYNRVEGERAHSILGLFNITSDLGELIDETD